MKTQIMRTSVTLRLVDWKKKKKTLRLCLEFLKIKNDFIRLI